MDTENEPHLVLCCECGTATPTNPTNMCVDCLRDKIDITEGIARQVAQSHCRGCNRYERQGGWVVCEPESKELLAILLKRVRGLDRVRLVDASFVWTEAHCKRLRTKLTVQKEVVNNAVLQATVVVEFVISNKQCDKCARVEAQDYWVSCIQLRQKVTHKRTMFWLEQLILKHNAHADSTSISEMRDGIDFFHGEKNHSEKLLSFLQTVSPLRYKTARQMITQDTHTGVCRNKYTYSVEIVPVCKDDLCVLPAETARHHASIHPLVLCHKVGAHLHFTDPRTLQTIEIQSYAYFKRPFIPLCTREHLREFVVLDVVAIAHAAGQQRAHGGDGASVAGSVAGGSRAGSVAGGSHTTARVSKDKTHGQRRATSVFKLQLAEVTVARLSDLGKNDVTFVVTSHLGSVLKAGDHVKGYDLLSRTIDATDYPSLKGKEEQVPDIVLVRKCYGNSKRKRRFWRLKCLRKEIDESLTAMDVERSRNDYENFLRDLEEDKEMRGEVNLYKDPDALAAAAARKEHPVAADEEDEDDDALSEAEVGLEELLDDLNLADNETFDDFTPPTIFKLPTGGGDFHFT